jgi:putative phosphoesterase
MDCRVKPGNDGGRIAAHHSNVIHCDDKSACGGVMHKISKASMQISRKATKTLSEREIVVGVISDTHGLMRPQALAALQGCDLIIHAGDVGNSDVLKELAGIAPTRVVRGNVDQADWAASLPMTELVDIGGWRFYVLHEISQLDFDPTDLDCAAVVFGHSHQPSIETHEGVLFLNPGSAGPRRFKLPVTVARIDLSGPRMRPQVVELQV